MAAPQSAHNLIDITAVAERLGVQVRHVRRLVDERRIPCLKWGHVLRFDPKEIDRWLDATRRPTHEDDRPERRIVPGLRGDPEADMASIDRWHGTQWRARYRAPDGSSRSRVFDRKIDAERFLTGVAHSKLVGADTDPSSGRVTVGEWASRWLATRVHLKPRPSRCTSRCSGPASCLAGGGFP